MIKLIVVGILACLLSLCLLVVMDSDKPEVLQSKTYVIGPIDNEYIIEGEQRDLFSEWQERQGDWLRQKEWDCYMKNE